MNIVIDEGNLFTNSEEWNNKVQREFNKVLKELKERGV